MSRKPTVETCLIKAEGFGQNASSLRDAMGAQVQEHELLLLEAIYTLAAAVAGLRDEVENVRKKQ